MQASTDSFTGKNPSFPPFDLSKLLKTVFAPQKDEKICILIDLDHPLDIVDLAFLKNENLVAQKMAYTVFYQGLHGGLLSQLKLAACDLYSYQTTGGSNLELPETAYALDGAMHKMDEAIYSKYDIILCIGTYSATAPLTATAKRFAFRGGTMHGLNETVLASGLSVDYNEVSRLTDHLRQGLNSADCVDIAFEVAAKEYHLRIDLDKQEAQMSHGLCHQGPDVVNLPAGEVYFVPTNAEGECPIKFDEDGTLGLMHVEEGRVTDVNLIRGNQKTVDQYLAKFLSDPATGIFGELGFGTQVLPYSGADVQDEKIFGTFHLATGRNDHLNGEVTKESFYHLNNASHDDILYSLTKTPEILVKCVRMHRHGKTHLLIENGKPSDYLIALSSTNQE